MNNKTELKLIIEEYFNTSVILTESSHAFFVYNKTSDSNEDLKFHIQFGFKEKENIDFNSLTNEMCTNLKIKMSFEKSASADIYLFINEKIFFSDWILIPIFSLTRLEQTGLLFLGRTDDLKYTEFDQQIVDMISLQFDNKINNNLLLNKMNDLINFNSTILSNISHEIRTPLHAMTGFLEILNLTEDADEKIKLSEGVKKNSFKLTQIINNILELSKIESGQIQIHKRKQFLSTLINYLESDLKMKAREKNLSYKIKIIGDLPICVEIDQERVRQIIFNLIDNAFKFTHDGEVLILIKFQREKNKLIFKVIDKGIGISKQTQLDLFKYFTQLDSSATRKYGGVGLGLSLSQRLAQHMDGHLKLVKSEINKGSTFQLTLPCVEFTKEEYIYPALENIKMNFKLFDKKVLLVEDSEDNQEIFYFYLKTAGLIPEIVSNGEDAVKKVMTSNYDFILMDIQLPKMDGIEATRLIRSHGYLQPIIALTAHASVEEKMKCLSAGCVDLITKPVSQNTFISQIQMILEAQ